MINCLNDDPPFALGAKMTSFLHHENIRYYYLTALILPDMELEKNTKQI